MKNLAILIAALRCERAESGYGDWIVVKREGGIV